MFIQRSLHIIFGFGGYGLNPTTPYVMFLWSDCGPIRLKRTPLTLGPLCLPLAPQIPRSFRMLFPADFVGFVPVVSWPQTNFFFFLLSHPGRVTRRLCRLRLCGVLAASLAFPHS